MTRHQSMGHNGPVSKAWMRWDRKGSNPSAILFYYIANPIAAICFDCAKQPSSDRIYQIMYKYEENYANVAIHMIIK
jgi:hypothetical protein